MRKIYNNTVKNYFNDSELEQLFLLVVDQLIESKYRVESRDNLIGIYLTNNNLGNNSFFYILKEESRFSIKFRGIDKTITFNTNNLQIIIDNLNQNIVFHNLQSIISSLRNIINLENSDSKNEKTELPIKEKKTNVISELPKENDSIIKEKTEIQIKKIEITELPIKEKKTNVISELPKENDSIIKEETEIQITKTEITDLKIELPTKEAKKDVIIELPKENSTIAKVLKGLFGLKENDIRPEYREALSYYNNRDYILAKDKLFQIEINQFSKKEHILNMDIFKHMYRAKNDDQVKLQRSVLKSYKKHYINKSDDTSLIKIKSTALHLLRSFDDNGIVILDFIHIYNKDDFEFANEYGQKKNLYMKVLKLIDRKSFFEAEDILKDLQKYSIYENLNKSIHEGILSQHRNNIDTLMKNSDFDNVITKIKNLGNHIVFMPYIDICNKHIMNYKEAKLLFEQKEYEKCSKLLTTLGNYNDSIELLEKCNALTNPSTIYCEAINQFEKRQYDFALKNFINLDDYLKSRDYIDKIEKLETNYNQGKRHFSNGNYQAALDYFEYAKEYKDSMKLISSCNEKFKLFEQDKKYIEIMSLLDSGKLDEAYQSISNLGSSYGKYSGINYEIRINLEHFLGEKRLIEEEKEINTFVENHEYEKALRMINRNYEVTNKKDLVSSTQRKYLCYIKENIDDFESHLRFENIIKSFKEYPNYENKEIEIKDVQMFYYTHIKEKILKFIELKDFKRIQYLYQALPKEEQTEWYRKINDAEVILIEEQVKQFVKEINYQEAIKLLEPHKDRYEFKDTYRNLQTLDNNQKLQEIELLYNDSQYDKVVNLVQNDKNPTPAIKELLQKSELRIKSYNEALILYKNKEYDLVLKKILTTNYLDSQMIIENSSSYIRQYNQSILLFSMNKIDKAIETIKLSNNYKDSNEKLLIYQEKKNAYDKLYDQAVELYAADKIDEAEDLFFKINGYKNSQNIINKIEKRYNQCKLEKEESNIQNKLENIRVLLKEQNFNNIKEIFTRDDDFKLLGFNCEFGMFPQSEIIDKTLLEKFNSFSIPIGYFVYKGKSYLKEEGETKEKTSYGVGRYHDKKLKTYSIIEKVIKYFYVQPMKWEILDTYRPNIETNSKYLITYVATKAVTPMDYDEVPSETLKKRYFSRDYSKSMIHKYLNSVFLNSHFDTKVKSAIKEVTILDYYEYKKLKTQVLATDYAVFKGATNQSGGCRYWTRNGAFILNSGNYDEDHTQHSNIRCIRPTLTIDFKKYLNAVSGDSSVRKELADITLKIIEIEYNRKKIQQFISNEKFDEALLLLNEIPSNEETEKIRQKCLSQINIYSQALNKLSNGHLEEAKTLLSDVINYKNSNYLYKHISDLIKIYDLAKSSYDSKKYIYALNLFSCITDTDNLKKIKLITNEDNHKDYSSTIDGITDKKLKSRMKKLYNQSFIYDEEDDWKYIDFKHKVSLLALQYNVTYKHELVKKRGSFSERITPYENPQMKIEYLGEQSDLIYDAELINYKDTIKLFENCLNQIYAMYKTKYKKMEFDEAQRLLPYLKAKKNIIEFKYTSVVIKKILEEAVELESKLRFKEVLSILEPIRHYRKAKDIYAKCFFEIHGIEYLKYFFSHIFIINNNNVKNQFDFVSGYPIVIAKQSYQSTLSKRRITLGKDWINVIFYPIENKPLTEYEHQSIANKIYEEIKTDNSHIFVKSEVFIVLVKETEGSKNDINLYKIFMFDKQYRFSPVDKINPIYAEGLYIVDDVKSELSIIQDKNIDAILCAKAYSGQLEIFEKTSNNIKRIVDDIDSHMTRIIVEGPARSGKTIIAFSLLKQYPNSILLLMNYHFYRSVKESFSILGIEFPMNRLFHHDLHKDRRDGCILKVGGRYADFEKDFVTDLDFVIVDEAQRLADLDSKTYGNLYLSAFDELTHIAKKPRLAVFLGDDNQRINPKYDYGLDKIRSILKNVNIKYENIFIEETIGIPANIIGGIKYLLTPSIEKTSPINKFEISIYSNEQKFINDFLSNKSYSKHYATLPGYTLNTVFSSLGLELYPYQLSYSDFSYFLNRKVSGHFIYSTYELISRELQSVYLIIPSSITYQHDNGIIDTNGIINQPYLFNHLYVNMTRATQKIVIFTNNPVLYEYLEARILNITNQNL